MTGKWEGRSLMLIVEKIEAKSLMYTQVRHRYRCTWADERSSPQHSDWQGKTIRLHGHVCKQHRLKTDSTSQSQHKDHRTDHRQGLNHNRSTNTAVRSIAEESLMLGRLCGTQTVETNKNMTDCVAERTDKRRFNMNDCVAERTSKRRFRSKQIHEGSSLQTEDWWRIIHKARQAETGARSQSHFTDLSRTIIGQWRRRTGGRLFCSTWTNEKSP